MTTKAMTTNEYIARLNLKNTMCTLVGSDLNFIKNTITTLMPDHNVKFENGPNNQIYLYHPGFANGAVPFGWISEYQVPTNLSVETTLEHRKAAAIEHAGTTR